MRTTTITATAFTTAAIKAAAGLMAGAATVGGGAAQAQTMTGYHIGNSLTWDARPFAMGDYAAANSGATLSTGYHINCSRSLNEIWASPGQTCVDAVPEFGLFESALATMELDYVTLQPFPAGNATLGSDTQVIIDMQSLLAEQPANADTPIYIYQAWGAPNFMRGPAFHEPVENDDATVMSFAQNYFDHLYDRVSAAVPAEVMLIPAGRVIDTIADSIERDEIEGVSTIWGGFYRDQIHMSYELGRCVASATVASVVLNQPPFGMHETWFEVYDDEILYPVETYIQLEWIIWDVISSDPRTGVSPCLADTNRDGGVDAADFNAWALAFNSQAAACDQNSDGLCDPSDFNAWGANFNAGC